MWHPGCGILAFIGALLLSSLAAVCCLAVPLTIPGVPVPVMVIPLVVVVIVLGIMWVVPIVVRGASVALLSPPRVSLLSSIV